jgi:predicted nuclease with TOPRIM domain
MKGDSMSEDLTKKLPQTDSEKISLILTTVQHLETRVDKIDLRLTNLEQRFDRLEQRIDRLEQRFDNLEQRVEERLYDTRPIWQKVVADIAQLQEGQTRLEGEVHEIKVSMRDISFQVSGFGDTLYKVLGKNRELEERVRDLERQPKNPPNSQT